MKDFERLTIKDLIGKNFYIPDYQRGYRWEREQVLQLVEDVWNFFNDSTKTASFYCLQPIVVKRRDPELVKNDPLLHSATDNNVWYDVIDGQQRLTTLRIILALYCRERRVKDFKYTICYQTRPDMTDVFDEIDIDYENQHDFRWAKDFVRNVDLIYIERAARAVLDCFWGRGREGEFQLTENEFNEFLGYFLNDKSGTKKSVQVLWYETREEVDPRQIFNRINDLRIPLSCSELIRGMFLSSSAEYILQGDEGGDAKERVGVDFARDYCQSHINAKWDEIEHKLHEDRFWAFITNCAPDSYRNRIELLFDLIAGKYVPGDCGCWNKNDRLYTYLWFEGQYAEWRKCGDRRDGCGALWRLWKRVLSAFSRLCAWYEDQNLYHRIGYLVYLQGNGAHHDRHLSELLTFAESYTKTEFRKEVVNRISRMLPPATELKTLSYEANSEQIKRLLLLHNVETSRHSALGEGVDAEQLRFPFDRYKRCGGWTLEHIHAQHSEGLDPNDKAVWRLWAKENGAALRNFDGFKDEDCKQRLLNRLEEAELADDSYDYRKIKALFDDVLKLFEVGEITPVMHQLSNLALLSRSINSGIGKSAFEVKRQYVISEDANGAYVPICTKKVFLKYYNLKGPRHVWGKIDRENYLKDIKERLRDYFNPECFKVEGEK